MRAVRSLSAWTRSTAHDPLSPSAMSLWVGPKTTNLHEAAGLATPEGLARKRKFAVVIAFVAAAILTPPDVVSQLLLALPIIALYELSIFGAKILAPEPYDEPVD